jgi:hypothetical protein
MASSFSPVSRAVRSKKESERSACFAPAFGSRSYAPLLPVDHVALRPWYARPSQHENFFLAYFPGIGIPADAAIQLSERFSIKH